MTHGKCDYAGCDRFGEQKVEWDDGSPDTEYCEKHALPVIDRDMYTVVRDVVSADG